MTWTDRDEAGDYVAPNVLSPRDLVSRPNNMDQTVLHVDKELTKIKNCKSSNVFSILFDSKDKNLISL